MKVVPFKPEHAAMAAAVAKLHHPSSIYRKSEFDEGRMVRYIQTMLSSPTCVGWALVNESGCHGGLLLMTAPAYGAFYDIAMDTFYAVTPSGKGHGLKLLKTALQWAKGQPHVKRVVFNLVAGTPDQKRAEELYKRLGMECVGSTWSLEV